MRQVQIEFHTYSPHPYPKRVSARSLWYHHIRSSLASNVSPRVHVSLWTAMSQSWSAHPVFHSFPVLFACVLQCFLSPVGSFAIVNQRLDIAHKMEIIQNTLAAHTTSLTLCVHSPSTMSFWYLQRNRLKKPVDMHSHWYGLTQLC